MYWIVATLSALVLLAALAIRLGRSPYIHRHLTIDRFPWLISSFEGQLASGAILIIEHEGSPRFVQFVIENDDPMNPRLGFGFPDAPWSHSYFEAVRGAVESLGHVVFEVATGDAQVPRYLESEIEGPVELWPGAGSAVARSAFSAMGLPPDAKFRAHFEGKLDHDRIRTRAVVSRSDLQV